MNNGILGNNLFYVEFKKYFCKKKNINLVTLFNPTQLKINAWSTNDIIYIRITILRWFVINLFWKSFVFPSSDLRHCAEIFISSSLSVKEHYSLEVKNWKFKQHTRVMSVHCILTVYSINTYGHCIVYIFVNMYYNNILRNKLVYL